MPAEIQAAARAVEHISTTFDELRARTARMRGRSGARHRGYFTPAEDEELRRLVITYWQARCALMEVLATMRAPEESPDDLSPARFLVACAAALVLIDAARDLRELAAGSRAIRQKLNEAEPAWGIPAGVYDTVQLSLTDPENALDLYSVLERLRSSEAELAAHARCHEIESMYEIIQRLRPRIEVSVLSYASARAVERVRQGYHAIGRDGLQPLLYDVWKFGSRLVGGMSVAPEHVPSLPAEVRRELSSTLQPGDVLITRKEHQLTNYFLPGYWPHAALFLGRPGELEEAGLHQMESAAARWQRLLDLDGHEHGRVVEALADGVRLRRVDSTFGCDALVVLRPQLDREHIMQALSRALFRSPGLHRGRLPRLRRTCRDEFRSGAPRRPADRRCGGSGRQGAGW